MPDAVMPIAPDGALPPAAAFLRWSARAAGGAIQATRLPLNNEALPDLLRLGGVPGMDIPGMTPFAWTGSGGAVVTVNAPAPGLARRGRLAVTPPPVVAGLAWEGAARVADALAVLGQGPGAPWELILARMDEGRDLRLDPPTDRHAAVATLANPDQGRWAAVNPLPFARRALVRLAHDGRAPVAVVDEHGARHPAQAAAADTEGPAGLLVSLDLGALATTALTADDAEAAGAHWEVSARVLDNGRVRVELDDEGAVARLCWDGSYAEWTGPAVRPMVDGRPFAGTPVVRVRESGPARALVSVTRTSPEGVLELSYALHAHDPALRVTARLTGGGLVELEHPTTHANAPLTVVDELTMQELPQAAYAELRGVRWAALADRAGRGVAIASGRPLALRVDAGRLLVPVTSVTRYALCHAGRGAEPWRSALTLSTPHLPWTGTARAARFALAAPAHVAPLWIAPSSGWDAELLLAEQAATRCRAILYPAREPGWAIDEAVKVDATGWVRGQVKPTPEGDGFHIDLAAGEIALVRWRMRRR